MKEAKEREDLLNRGSGEGTHILQIFDDDAQAMNSVKKSKRLLEDSFLSEFAILANYAEQRDRSKVTFSTKSLIIYMAPSHLFDIGVFRLKYTESTW